MNGTNFNPMYITSIKALSTVKQKFSDSYLVASLSALSRKECGQKVIQKNVTQCLQDYNIRFNDVLGTTRNIFVSGRDIDQLEYRKQHILGTKCNITLDRNLAAFEVAMGKIIQKYPSQKPLIYRLMQCDEIFEYNKVSRFMKMFTGKPPLVLKFPTFDFLSSKKKKSFINNFFWVLAMKREHAFVAGTGMTSPFNPLKSFHCYTIRRATLTSKKVYLYDNKTNKEIVLSFEEARKNLKYIAGYFEEDLT